MAQLNTQQISPKPQKKALKSVKERVDNVKLKKALEYRKWGGIISYLMKNKEGMRDFVYEELYKMKLPPEVFLQDMGRKFPDLPKAMYPSISAVRDFKKKLANEGDKNVSTQTQALALKDELKIMEVMKDFNIFKERLDIYQKTDFALQKVEKAIESILVLMEKTGLPPAPLWSALESYLKALEERSKHLLEIDKLSVRFGYLPAMPIENKNFIFNPTNVNGDVVNNNVEINDETKEIFNIRVQQLLALTKGKEDNDKMFESYPKASEVIKKKAESK